MSQNHRDLFRIPNTVDKLNLLQALLDLKDLTSDLALALINIIRAELAQPQKQSASAYRRYAEVLRCLCTQMPEVYEQVVRDWQQKRQASNPPRSPVQESVQAASEAIRATESEEEPGQREEKHPPEDI